MKFTVTGHGNIRNDAGDFLILWPEWGRWFHDRQIESFEVSQVCLHNYDLKLVKSNITYDGSPASPVWVALREGAIPLAFRLCPEKMRKLFPRVRTLYIRRCKKEDTHETSPHGRKG